MLFVTFHGGRSPAVNNVIAYDDDGNLLNPQVLAQAPSSMSELRGLRLLSDTMLWVLSGSAGFSAILAFGRDPTKTDTFVYAGPAAQPQPGPGLLHPFDFDFDSGGDCYVSNQDTDVVLRLGSDGKPAPWAPALQGKGTFWPGTFVASADPDLPRGGDGGQSSAAISPPAGLEDWPPCQDGGCPKLSNSVRGVAWTNDVLYVADEVAAVVKMYGSDGTFLGQSNCIGTSASAATAPKGGPVHLLVVEENGAQALLVTNGENVFSAVLDPAHPAALDLESIASIDVPKVAGLALAPGGVLYAASRIQDTPVGKKQKQARIFKYTNFPAAPKLDSAFVVGVDDVPEFVLYLP